MLAGVLLATLAACEPEAPAPPPVATWEDTALAQEVFAAEYRLYASRAPGRDDLARRADYARLMLERVLIAETARTAGLDTLGEVQAHVQRRTDWARRRHFLQTAIGDTIPEPTEAEVREAFRRTNTRLRLQQIYAPTQAAADSLRRLLAAGADFDALAAASMRRAGVPNPDSASYMGWVTWNDFDLAPEEVVFTLEPGAVSEPVASLMGWHIFRLHDREEQVRVDASAYQNVRDRLRFLQRQRRFDEASTRYLRAVLGEVDLAIYPRVLAQLWPAIAPYVPQGRDPYRVAAFNEAGDALVPEALTPTTPVATVDGRPFTVQQFLDGLPEVPHPDWRPDLRGALETTIRDSILTAVAVAHEADTARSVQREQLMAERSALYYAALRAVADTLDVQRARQTLYDRWKNAYFVASVQTAVRRTVFADSAAVWQALRRFQQHRDWGRALAEAEATPEVRVDTVTAPEAAIHDQPVSTAERPLVTGPYPSEGGWEVREVTDRRRTYQPYEADTVQTALDRLAQQQLPTLAHEALLPPGYDADAVVLDEEALRTALPMAGSAGRAATERAIR